jgi:hypothetical protein
MVYNVALSQTPDFLKSNHALLAFAFLLHQVGKNRDK